MNRKVNVARFAMRIQARPGSQMLAEGRQNGIVAFDQSWKNVAATLCHELNEFRTDADVKDAIESADNDFLGWMSRQGRECGDQPIFVATSLSQVFQEVMASNGICIAAHRALHNLNKIDMLVVCAGLEIDIQRAVPRPVTCSCESLFLGVPVPSLAVVTLARDVAFSIQNDCADHWIGAGPVVRLACELNGARRPMEVYVSVAFRVLQSPKYIREPNSTAQRSTTEKGL